MDCSLRAGDRIDTGAVYRINSEGTHELKHVESLLDGSRVLIFGGPAPFSRLDTEQAKLFAHHSAALIKHVKFVYGFYAQDAFVMKRFDDLVRETEPNHNVNFYGDADLLFAKNYGLDHDFTFQGLGTRTGRYVIVANNGIVEHVIFDDYSEIKNTHPIEILKLLES